LFTLYEFIEKFTKRGSGYAHNLVCSPIIYEESTVADDCATGIHDAGLAVIFVIFIG
jgi:hypothetical protein